jgi:RND family efflux transporter MFP subunit
MNGSARGSARPGFFLGPKSTKRRKSAQGLLALAVVIGLTVTGRWLLASVAKSRGLAKGEAVPASVRVVELRDEVVTSGVRYSAVVKELHKAEMSFRVAGTVEFLQQVRGPGGRLRGIHEGDTLRKGEVVARLDPSDYRRERGVAAGRLATAEARLSQAQSDTELAGIEYRRAEQLKRRNAISTSEQDSAIAKLRSTSAAEDAARREVETARVELEKADANLGYCTLTVPFEEGTVAAQYIEKDERIAANQKAFLLIDVTSVVISFMVPDTLVGRLAIGQPLEVGTEALPGEKFTGVIHKIATSADQSTRTYPVEVRVDRPRGLRPGMVANVHFRHEERARLLPLTSVGPGPTSNSFVVYRVSDEGGRATARQVPVEFDAVLDNRVAVRDGGPDGLKPGDRVVATGIHRLHDGEAVLVVE